MTCYQITEVRAMTLGTEAVTVPVQGLACLVENNSDSASVYLRERRFDGAAAGADNSWILPPGSRTVVPLVAMDLSLAASAADTDVRVMILDTV